jgi:predicted RNA-binding Zn-ribbon protein involved in translation (DUF1610 family)
VTTDHRSSEGLCASCGVQLAPNDASTAPYCSQCAADRAERDLASRQTDSAVKRPDDQERARARHRARTTTMWVLGILALAVIAWRAPLVYSSTRPRPPLRIGVQTTDRRADQCIANLWIAASKLPADTAAEGLTCPASGRPYSATKQDTRVVVACPSPEEHGLKSLSVNSVTLVPEVQ